MTFERGVTPTKVKRRMIKSVVPYWKVNLCAHCVQYSTLYKCTVSLIVRVGIDNTVLYTNVFFRTGNRFTHGPHVNFLE